MKRNSQRRLIPVLTGILSLGLGSVSSIAQAESASAVFHFAATLISGSCVISAPASLQFNGGNTLFGADIEAAGMEGSSATTVQFNLILQNCTGWGGTPRIVVSGQQYNDINFRLFRDADALGIMDSVGYGVLLKTAGNSSFNENTNLAVDGNISVKNWSMNTQLNTLNNTLPITAILSCGDCANVGRHGGKFQATVIFDFVYE